MRRRPLLVASSLLALSLLVLVACGGCGGSKGEAPARAGDASARTPAPGGSAPADTVRAYQPSPATDASIAGKVALEGDPPRMVPHNFDADPTCSQIHGDAKVLKEEVVAKEGRLKNVLVYAKSSSRALEGLRFETPTTPVVLDQKGCLYQPHVFGVRTGQPIAIRNSDATSHNIKCAPKKNSGFNISQAKKGMEDEKKFDKEESAPPIRLECNVHPWMNGYAGVFSHPFFAVTGEDGTYSIPGLPPGDYEIVAWQESTKLDGPKTEKVTLGPKESRTLDFTFKVK
ncbi:MAG: carboxypeptidase regulatory-like domain-containing protein [Planctomycetes bacterium]|nr:carboxypeptidase regulatory-like domain-containing protein [Planctomycetota bacterium]